MPTRISIEFARAAGDLAADQQMREQGRAVWNDEDRALAAEVMHRLLLNTPCAPQAIKESNQ